MSKQTLLSHLAQAFLLVGGSLLSSIAVIVFMAPADIAPGGVSGISVLLNEVIGTPIGLMILLGNIPVQYLGYRMLGGNRYLMLTVISITIYSLGIDLLEPFFDPVSSDRLLNAIYGGVMGGVGGAMIYRTGATAGGTATLARILQYRFGLPLSTATLYTDTLIMILAGLVYGWEGTLLAIVALVVGGITSDYVMEGPSIIRTVTIITDSPDEVAQTIIQEVRRGVTAWKGEGMYTHQERHILFVTISRSQVKAVRELILSVDPDAFIVIGQGHIAYGQGFRKTRVIKLPEI
jgi:uncharacterized membrane-anchored protein YitT (DUF2179 family)